MQSKMIIDFTLLAMRCSSFELHELLIQMTVLNYAVLFHENEAAVQTLQLSSFSFVEMRRSVAFHHGLTSL